LSKWQTDPSDNPPPYPFPTLNRQDQENAEEQLVYNLIIINIGILLASGAAGYFLAGRTLRPIKTMIDEQNQFVSNASHELRTPIATMRAEMESSLLERKISEQKARQLIASNLEELETLQSLSNRLLRLAHAQSPELEKYMEAVSLLEVVQSAQKKVIPLAQKKHITIKQKLSEEKLHGVKSELIEVFVILLDNAIKYSPEKKNILISAESEEKKVKIHVLDQGYGIVPEDLPNIFNRFYRSDKSRSKTEGYGLGLSIAKKIINNHKGTISVKSNPGKGTTFIIDLPILSK
jgi:signal transduction histidine kinase